MRLHRTFTQLLPFAIIAAAGCQGTNVLARETDSTGPVVLPPSNQQPPPPCDPTGGYECLIGGQSGPTLPGARSQVATPRPVVTTRLKR